MRLLHIQTASTPNPACLKFVPGKSVTGDAGATMDFSESKYASISPLAISLFSIGGVIRVFYGKDFISVTKEENLNWNDMKEEIISTIEAHYKSGQQLYFEDVGERTDDLLINPDDSEALQMVKEII